MDSTRALLRLELSDGEVRCPRKGVLAKGRCVQMQGEFSCTCAAAADAKCAVGPVPQSRPALRSYQRQGVDAILRELRTHRSTVWVCPTGGGKSRVFCEVARRLGGRVLALADRVALVDQAAGNFANYAEGVAVECATVQLASKNRWLDEHPPDAFDLIIIDEADLAIAPSYRRIVDHFPAAKVVGVTATPDRHDGKPIGELFESGAGAVEMLALIRDGYLVRIRLMVTTIESVSLAKAPVEAGDFNREALGRILAAERPLHEVSRVTIDNAGDRPTIVFAASIAHAEALCAVFNRYRTACARVVHSQHEEDDDEIRAAFERREFQFLINVAMLTRGIDLPLTACVAMAAPTMSRPRYAHMLGRGTRPSPETGKRDLLVLDFVGNGETHKLASVVDVLGEKISAETRERVRERLEEEPGGDVLAEVEAATVELESDSDLLARVQATVQARMVEINPFAAKWTDWDSLPLGKVPDTDIAKQIGVSQGAVRAARLRRRISAYKPSFLDKFEGKPLGEVEDQVIADEMGIPKGQVWRARMLKGIPPFNQQKSSLRRGAA